MWLDIGDRNGYLGVVRLGGACDGMFVPVTLVATLRRIDPQVFRRFVSTDTTNYQRLSSLSVIKY